MSYFDPKTMLRILRPDEIPAPLTPEEQEQSRMRLEELLKSLPATWSTEKIPTKSRDNGNWMLRKSGG